MGGKARKPHTAVVTCGECGRTMQIALGLASAIGCTCGAEIWLAEPDLRMREAKR